MRVLIKFYILLNLFPLKKREIISIDYDVERRVYVCSVSGIVNWCCCYGIHYGGSSELKIDLQYNLAIPPLSIYMKKMKTFIWKAKCQLLHNKMEEDLLGWKRSYTVEKADTRKTHFWQTRIKSILRTFKS